MFLLYCLSLIEGQEQKDKFEQMYLTHRHTMLFAAKKILKDHALAEDAVQGAFLRVLHHLEKIDAPISQKTRAFLVIIVRNISIDMYRKRARGAEISFDGIYVDMPFEQESEDGYSNVVVDTIKKLPPLYAHTMALRYLYEFSDRDCAKLLEISETALRKRLERGRNLLEELLEKEGVDSYV